MDLSKVLFICTANVLDNSTITTALYDRMEVIELDGYTLPEKKVIFWKHIFPKLVKETGLDLVNFKVEIDDLTLE